MNFTIPFLTHGNSIVRDSAVQVVVELSISTSQKVVFQHLTNETEKHVLSPQLIKTLNDKMEECKKQLGIHNSEGFSTIKKKFKYFFD
jgi:hypothetical protein